MQVQKAVFISYRRTNLYTARAVYQYLIAQGFDVFLDYENIDAGSFEKIILNQIAARAHFLLILTPSALERCSDPNDWLRREVEHAITLKRNIVPLAFEGFKFEVAQKYLIGNIKTLAEYNAIEVPDSYFNEAMARLVNRFLKPLETVVHPTPNEDVLLVQQWMEEIQRRPGPSFNERKAESLYERARAREKKDRKAKINDYTQALKLNPRFAEAYSSRGFIYVQIRQYEKALADFNEAIRINTHFAEAFLRRGMVYEYIGKYDEAISDFNEAIRLNPRFVEAYTCRGTYYRKKKDLKRAISDYTKAIQHNPDNAYSYYKRAIIYDDKGDTVRAISDYDKAIKLNPRFHLAYNNRGITYSTRWDYDRAIIDYDAAIRLKPRFAEAYRNRGIAYQNKKDLVAANLDYEKYLTLKGDKAEDAGKVQGWLMANKALLEGI